ncbi:MAG TPA: OmpA family protein [Mucilaginibacter sp.]
MYLKITILFLLFLKAAFVMASGTDTLKLYYAIDEYQLSPANKGRLDSIKTALKSVTAVTINGYADYLGQKIPNIDLSKNRAETVKQYLLTLNNTLNITTAGNGAVALTTARSAAGQPVNRRVDVIYEAPKVYRIVRTVIRRQGFEEPRRPPQPAPSPAPPAGFTKKMDSLNNVAVGSSVGFEELTFQGGRHLLNPEAAQYLEGLSAYLKKHDNIRFEIIGHICCEVPTHEGFDMDTHQYALSVNRAKYIYDYFIQHGIDPNRMTYKGVGASKPKAYPELTEHDRYINRRVELLITGKQSFAN